MSQALLCLAQAWRPVFYDGEDPDLGEVSVEDFLSDIKDAVLAAEAEAA